MITLGTGIVLILFGLVWLGIMGAIYSLCAFTSPEIALPWYWMALWFGPGIVMLPVGIILAIIGVALLRKKEIANQQMQNNRENCIMTKARVTFVDKEYVTTMSEMPLFSLVEYEFTDDYGKVFTGRKDQVDSDLVIRNKIEVGSEVDIVYATQDPNINGLMLTDPREVKKQ